jgi:AbrB family looped-hinge helix DNA binding protein
MKCYGSTVIGEKGQIVIPAEVRKKFGIKTGDKFLVMTGHRGVGIMLLKADSLAKFVRQVFGDDLSNLLDMGTGSRRLKRSRTKRK